MKQMLISFVVLALSVSFVVFAFTLRQIQREQTRLEQDLQRRSTVLAENFRDVVEPNFANATDKKI